MSREIKFRAWAKDEHLMLSMSALQTKSLCQLLTDDRLILMQYTGLKDKNGKEIYEGDICRINTQGAFPPYGNPDSEELTDIATLAVEWWNGQFVFNANRYKYLDNGGDDYINFGWWVRSNDHKTSLKQIEVIGNLYENPELLEANT